MLLLVATLATMLTVSHGQRSEPGAVSALVAEAEACRVDYIEQGKWGGRVAVYDATTDAAGAIARLARREMPDRAYVATLVKLDQFEVCLKRWRFGGLGVYTVSLFAGTIYEGAITIEVTRDGPVFRLRVPK